MGWGLASSVPDGARPAQRTLSLPKGGLAVHPGGVGVVNGEVGRIGLGLIQEGGMYLLPHSYPNR